MGHFWLLPRVGRGRVPRAWFDILGTPENYHVALPGYGIGVIGLPTVEPSTPGGFRGRLLASHTRSRAKFYLACKLVQVLWTEGHRVAQCRCHRLHRSFLNHQTTMRSLQQGALIRSAVVPMTERPFASVIGFRGSLLSDAKVKSCSIV